VAQERSNRGGQGGKHGGGQGGKGRSGGSRGGRPTSGRSASGRSSAGRSGTGRAGAGDGSGGRSSKGGSDDRRSGAGRGTSGRSGTSTGKGQGRSAGAGRDGRGKRTQGGGYMGNQSASAESRDAAKARRDLKGAAVDLPRWVIDDLSRVTPRERISDALTELGTASNAMIEGRYKVALRAARKAKDLAPRDATVRETLGLAAYRTGDWQTALQELRAYRRIAGEATHMPIEMDTLRALGRAEDVTKTWQELQSLGGAPAVLKEGVVVYASFLIDEGRLDEARVLASPQSVKPNPYPADLRVWYVAARANALSGDAKTARRLRDAIMIADPAFPGMDDLETTISKATP